jgi:tetratricopeptide (TPR) repeat protein
MIFLFLFVNELVWQALITNLFWLAILITIILAFRSELRALVGSVASFKVAGASFELKDKKATIESWAILTNILIEVLSQRESSEQLAPFISDASARQLTKFALKYAKDSFAGDKDVELLKSIAYLVGRKGNTKEALSIYDTLLQQSPDDRDVLNLEGALLLNQSNAKYLPTAEKIFVGLAETYPDFSHHWYNLGLTKTRLGKWDEAIPAFREAKERGWKLPLDNKAFDALREARPQEFADLCDEKGSD